MLSVPRHIELGHRQAPEGGSGTTPSVAKSVLSPPNSVVEDPELVWNSACDLEGEVIERDTGCSSRSNVGKSAIGIQIDLTVNLTEERIT